MNLLKTVALLLVLCTSALMAAESSSIAVLDFQKVLEKYNKSTDVQKTIQGMIDERQDKFQKAQEDLDKKQKDFENEKEKMTAEARTAKENELIKQIGEFQDLGGKFEEEIKKFQDTQFEMIRKEILEEAEKVAKSLKLNVILEKNAVYLGGNDITEKVIEALNKNGKK